MISENELIALFNSPTRVMKAEKSLREAGLPCRLVPAPREVAEGCSMALRFADSDKVAVFRELAKKNLLPPRLYCKRKEGFFSLPLPSAE
ncbi:MAG: DUF3343 domain-containing protein [Syntrophotaleaceae bacterium]